VTAKTASFARRFSQNFAALFRQSIQTSAQAGLVARGGVGMDGALLDCLINERSGGTEVRFSRLLVRLGQGFTEGAQGSAEPRFIGAVHSGPSFGLAGALKR
jgi:hypothetical protein